MLGEEWDEFEPDEEAIRAAREVAAGLRQITSVLDERGLADGGAGGLLGGEYGYGADFRNEVFSLHRYCWCEQDDCAWCVGCTCSDGAYRYFVEDVEVTSDEFNVVREGEGYGKVSWGVRSTVKSLRTESVEELQCEFCRSGGRAAPNFEHFASGTKVWWYKYLGRSMDVELHGEWRSVLSSCVDSLPVVVVAVANEQDPGRPRAAT